MLGNAAESFGKTLGVTMAAAPRDFGAAGYRVPGCISPFDCGFVAHL